MARTTHVYLHIVAEARPRHLRMDGEMTFGRVNVQDY